MAIHIYIYLIPKPCDRSRQTRLLQVVVAAGLPNVAAVILSHEAASLRFTVLDLDCNPMFHVTNQRSSRILSGSLAAFAIAWDVVPPSPER